MLLHLFSKSNKANFIKIYRRIPKGGVPEVVCGTPPLPKAGDTARMHVSAVVTRFDMLQVLNVT